MNQQLLYLLIFIAGYILLLLFCELLNRKAHVPSEYTRKLAHIASTLSTLFFAKAFTDYRYVLILCLAFFIMLLIANMRRMLHSIDGVGRRTGGSYLLALSVGITYCVSVQSGNNMLFTLPVLILAISDPLAGIVGNRIKSKRLFNRKTVAGSLSFLISSYTISLIYLNVSYHEHVWMISAVVALVATLTELISPRGTDNLTIPLVVVGILMLI